MRAFAFNCSPRMGKSTTALVLNPFLEGLRDGDVEVELLYAYKLKVNPCLGDYNCWTRTPGKCVQDDDMSLVLPKIRDADFVVFAAPLYVDGMPGPMKTLIDRLIPMLKADTELRNGHCRHPTREETKHAKFVLISNCGFWEMDNFDPLIMHVKAICKNAGWEYAGALLRPHGPALSYMHRKGYPVQDVFDAARKAGKEIAETGKINEETIKAASRELLPLGAYVESLNQGFQKAIDRAKPREA